MYIDPQIFGVHPDIANQLLLDVFAFSEVSCTYGQLYNFDYPGQKCDFTVTECLLQSLVKSLAAVHQLTETRLGHPLVKTYRQFPLEVDKPTKLPAHLLRCAVQQVEVDRLPVLVNFYTTPTKTEVNTEYFTISVPTSFCDDPDDVFIRDHRGLQVLSADVYGYPAMVDDNFIIAVPYSHLETLIKVWHRFLVYVDVPKGYDLVYPGSKQIVAVHRRTSLNEMTDRVLIKAWALVKPQFYDKGYDYGRPRMYHMFTSLDAIKTEEVNQNLGDYWVEVVSNPLSVVCLRTRSTHCDPQLVSFLFDPEQDSDYSNRKGAVAMAMAYYVAAELPTTICNCPLEKSYGFIKQAQTPYTDLKVDITTGGVFEHIRYGQTHGHLTYQTMLRNHPTKNAITFI